jgi:hypothetical protein
VFEKPYSDFQRNIGEIEDLARDKNHSMVENYQKSAKNKKPPAHNLNKLYQKADKQLLNRIQNILKNKDTKKLNYASSEESN